MRDLCAINQDGDMLLLHLPSSCCAFHSAIGTIVASTIILSEILASGWFNRVDSLFSKKHVVAS